MTAGAATPVDFSRRVRRVVTGRDGYGKAVVLSDETVAGDARSAVVWSCNAPPRDDGRGQIEPYQAWWPPPGGVRVTLWTRAPDGDLAPGRGSSPYPDINDAAGFHASVSVDVVIVISGRIWLELDDGREVELGPADVLIQNGARHRWRNRGHEWPVLAALIVGAQPVN